MDIRDFKEEPKPVKDGKYLEEIYSLQKLLVDSYIKVEGLPHYPIDVNTKASQVLLKDFTGRVVEELAEGFESHEQVIEIIKKNQFNPENLSSVDKKMVINHLQNLNEEQADAMHFMVELMLYANIYPEDILKFINTYWVPPKGYMVTCTEEDGILAMVMEVGFLEVISKVNDDIDSKREVDLYPLLNKEQKKYVPGGTMLFFGQYTTVDLSEKFLWSVTYALNLSRNCLKNKPWKQTGVMTNESLYQSLLVKGFILMCGYFKSIGLNEEEVYYLYFKKNLANRFRIESKY